MVCASGAVHAQSGSIQYIYDELGRLVGVIDAAGQTATYRYDAVGNLLSIERHGPSDVSVIEFTPDSGPTNTTVTIHGTGFSAIPSQNSVTFNGMAATVISATSTQLVTSVPSGATTGLIAVTAPSGSATSSSPFTIAPSLAPSISGFSPAIGVVGSSVTISGTNFDAVATRNRVKFNATVGTVGSATPVSLTATVPPFVGSGHIHVSTSFGTAVSADDFFVAPAPYTAADVLVTFRMSLGGSLSVPLGTSNKIALVVFDGVAGQRASVKATMTSGTWGCTWPLQMLQPNGSVLAQASICSPVGLLEPATLPTSGTYSLFLDPAGSNTGTATVNLYNVVDVTTSITINGPAVAAELITPGQNARLPFAGTANQRVSVLQTMTSGNFGCGAPFEIRKAADDSLVGSGTSPCGGTTGFLEPVALPTTDNYVVVVNPVAAFTGTATVNLYDVVDVTTPITINGPAVTAGLTTPGQNARLPFTGTANQRVSVLVTMTSGNFGCGAPFEIRKAADNSLVGNGGSLCGGAAGFMEPVALPATDNYVVVVNPVAAFTGTATVNLYNVVDETTPITINGSPVTAALTTPGQNARLPFTGTVGQSLSVGVNVTSGWFGCSWSIEIRKAADNSLTGSASSCGTAGSLGPIALPATDSYVVVVNPSGFATGTASVTLTQP
jgi:YD repeat-containing protein